MKKLPEQINSRDSLVKQLSNYEVTESIVRECEGCGAITPSGKKPGPGRTGRYTYSREHMVIIIACTVLWEMGIERSEREQLLKGCSLEDIKEIQREIKASSYLQFLDFLKKKKGGLKYERAGLRNFLTFKLP